MKMMLMAAASALMIAACSPPAAEQSSTPTIEMSEASRTQMDAINSSRFTMAMTASLADVPAFPTQLYPLVPSQRRTTMIPALIQSRRLRA